MIEPCPCGNKPEPRKEADMPLIWTIRCCQLVAKHPEFVGVLLAWNSLIKNGRDKADEIKV